MIAKVPRTLCETVLAGWLVLSLLAFATYAQRPQLQTGKFGSQATASPLKASAVIVPASGSQPPVLVVTAAMDNEHWIYSITQERGGPIPTKIKITESDQFRVGDFEAYDEPKLGYEESWKDLVGEKHIAGTSWYAPLLLAEGVSVEQLSIQGKLYAQVCDVNNCLPPKDHPFEAKLGKSPIPLPSLKALDPSLFSSSGATSQAAAQPMLNPEGDGKPSDSRESSQIPPGVNDPSSLLVEGGEAPPGLSGSTMGNADSRANLGDYDLEQLSPTMQGLDEESSLPWMIGAALLAGFILNFMPCVLPVIGLKLMSFLEQAGDNPRHVFALNAWYSLGIVSIFWLLAAIAIVLRIGFGQTFGWGQQFSYDGFNIALICVVFVMALSFLGVWEIPIPGFASSRNAQNLVQKEGALGAFAKGAITTVLATPCSGPFLGTAVGFALKSSPLITVAIFTLMGLGMSAPYLLVGMRPSLVKFLPKPGAWMDTFKQLMGFVLVGTVLWLMVPIDAKLLMPTLILLTGLAAACWWIGRTPGYAERSEKIRAWAIAGLMAGFTGWLGFATPQVTDPLPWRKFSMSQFVSDVNSDKTVLVEFTAEWCATCKALKAAILDRSKTKDTVTKNNVVVYEVDIDEISDKEREFFTRMQPSQGVPLVAIFPAGKKYQPISFGNGYTQSQILEALRTAGPSQSKKR